MRPGLLAVSLEESPPSGTLSPSVEPRPELPPGSPNPEAERLLESPLAVDVELRRGLPRASLAEAEAERPREWLSRQIRRSRPRKNRSE